MNHSVCVHGVHLDDECSTCITLYGGRITARTVCIHGIEVGPIPCMECFFLDKGEANVVEELREELDVTLEAIDEIKATAWDQLIACTRERNEALIKVERLTEAVKRVAAHKDQIVSDKRNIGNRFLRSLLRKRRWQMRAMLRDLSALKQTLRSLTGQNTDLLSRPSRFESGRSDQPMRCKHGRKHRCIDCVVDERNTLKAENEKLLAFALSVGSMIVDPFQCDANIATRIAELFFAQGVAVMHGELYVLDASGKAVGEI